MTTGVVLFARAGSGNAVDDIVTQARRAHRLGTRHVWVAQQFDHDAISLAGLIGAAVPGLGVGTSVVPFNPRHPLTLASQAQTAQAAAHGNFSLGLGLGAHEPERIAYGAAWPNTIARLREYLTILRSIFDDRRCRLPRRGVHGGPGMAHDAGGRHPGARVRGGDGPEGVARHR